MKLFVKRDLDGFFGLFVDNLVQILVIILFCSLHCGMTGDDSRLLFEVVLPGTAISILFGNLFYAWQAHRLAKKEGRDDVTSLPYGINTPSIIVFVFFIIKPEFDRTQDVLAAWRMGLLACLGSGVIEFLGAFAGGIIRRHTPRAALLSTLAGIAIGFISMTFALQIFHLPLIALLPFAVILVGLFAKAEFPYALPAGFIAIFLGTLAAWGLYVIQQYIPGTPAWLTFAAADPAAVTSSLQTVHLSLPVWCGDDVVQALNGIEDWLPFLTVVIPMGLFNVIGSMQNIESAEASGDSYPTAPSMAVNGLGTIVAALFGSCFPTTIYIGHPGWKGLGARAGYSTLNGVVIVAICLLGLVGLIASVIPVEVGAGIVLWIGMIITAQAFNSTPGEHAPAVAVGLFPAIAAWGATVMMGTLTAAGGTTLQDLVTPAPEMALVENDTIPPSPATPDRSTQDVNGFLVHALLLMDRGYIFTCMILAAACASLIDRRFRTAALWMFAAALFTWLGLMHAYQVYYGFAFDYLFRFMDPVEGAYAYRGNDIALAYLLCGLFFLAMRNAPRSAAHD